MLISKIKGNVYALSEAYRSVWWQDVLVLTDVYFVFDKFFFTSLFAVYVFAIYDA